MSININNLYREFSPLPTIPEEQEVKIPTLDLSRVLQEGACNPQKNVICKKTRKIKRLTRKYPSSQLRSLPIIMQKVLISLRHSPTINFSSSK